MALAKEQIRQIINQNDITSVTDVYSVLKESFKDILQELSIPGDSEPVFRKLFFATPKYLKMQTFFPKVAAGNSSFLHVSPA